MTFEKYERDGKVAVLISPDFGAGWSTWNSDHADQLLFDRRLVELVLAGGVPSDELLDELFGEDNIYTGGLRDIRVEWLNKGTQFYIREYDGSETIVTTDDLIHTA